MLFVQNGNFKGLCVLSSKLLEMHRNQSFSLNDESIKDIGVVRHELDLYPNFYLIKSVLCVSLLTPFNILDRSMDYMKYKKYIVRKRTMQIMTGFYTNLEPER